MATAFRRGDAEKESTLRQRWQQLCIRTLKRRATVIGSRSKWHQSRKRNAIDEGVSTTGIYESPKGTATNVIVEWEYGATCTRCSIN